MATIVFWEVARVRRILSLFLLALLLCGLVFSFSSCGRIGKTNLVEIRVRDFGSIVVELYPDVAPITVENFKNLVASGFYEESIFHRIIEDFMIQGGISAKGETAEPIYGEFAANGYDNGLLHTRGVISMARTSFPNSASSQFFIVQRDKPHLDGYYAAFGRVISGMEVVDAIAAVDTDSGNYPETEVVIEKIVFLKEK